MYTLIMKKPKDLAIGDEIVTLQHGPEILVLRISELHWDNGDLFLEFTSHGGAQLRDEELHEPILVVGSSV